MNLAAFLRAEKVSQAAFASQLGVTQGLVWQWLNGRTKIVAERVLQIERATDGKVTRHELRPDLYPPEAETAQATGIAQREPLPNVEAAEPEPAGQEAA